MKTIMPDVGRQQASTSKVRAQFYQLTHDQAAFPMPWRGESGRLDLLSAEQFENGVVQLHYRVP